MSTLVCALDGVEVAQARSGALIHIDELPKGVDPEHVVVGIDADARRITLEARTDLRLAAQDMLLHHATVHPLSECEWATRLSTAIRSA